jgi:hypothetical protein
LLLESLLKPWGSPIGADQLRWLLRSLMTTLFIGTGYLLLTRAYRGQ